jgi:hypothetical protein
MPYAPITNGDSSGTLADTTDIDVYIDGTQVTGSVSDIRPLLGHIILNQTSDYWTGSELGRLPQIGDTVLFDYSYGQNYEYSEIFDTYGRVTDQYGSNTTYSIVHDTILNESLIENISYLYSKNATLTPTPLDGTWVSGNKLSFPYSLGLNWQLPKIPVVANSLSLAIDGTWVSNAV